MGSVVKTSVQDSELLGPERDDFNLIDHAADAGNALRTIQPELLPVKSSHASSQRYNSAVRFDLHKIRRWQSASQNKVPHAPRKVFIVRGLYHGRGK